MNKKNKKVMIGGVDVRELGEEVIKSFLEGMEDEDKKEMLEYLEYGDKDKLKEERIELIKDLILEVDKRLKAKKGYYWRYGVIVKLHEIREAWGAGHVYDESFLLQFKKYLSGVNNKYEAGFSSVSGERKFYLRKKGKYIFLDGDEKS